MSLEISYSKKKIVYQKFLDSPLNGFNSLNVNTRRYYVTLSDSKRTIDNSQIDP